MSIVLPSKYHRSDFLAPSKAFQDAKETLGPEYFDPQLIECPQNAVELSKLIKEWDELDKQRFKAVEEARKSQRVLLHTLNSRYTFSKSSVSLETLSGISDVKLPPPGFRYHADGSKKVDYGSSRKNSVLDLGTNDEEGEENDSFVGDTIHAIGKKSVTVTIPQRIDIVKKVKTSKLDTTDSKPLLPETERCNERHEIDKETLLRFKLEIEQMIEDSERRREIPNNSTLSRCRSSKQLLFEPMTRTDTSADKGQSQDRCPFRQKSVGFFRVESKIDALYKPPTKTPICSKCTACRYKLQHSSVDFRKLQQSLNNPKFRRWNIAPQGKLVESPKYTTRMTSAVRGRIPRRQSGTGGTTTTTRSPNSETSENQPMLDRKTSAKGKTSDKEYTQNVKSKSPTIGKTAGLTKSKTTSEVAVRNVKSANVRQAPKANSAYELHQSTSNRLRSAYSTSGMSSPDLSYFKSLAADESLECEEKVKDFLIRLNRTGSSKPKVKMAF